MQRKILNIFILNLILSNLIYCQSVVQIKKEAKTFEINKPLDFKVGPSAVFTNRGDFLTFGFFMGSAEKKTGNEYAISVAARGTNVITPLAPAKIMLNSKPNQINPLNGAKISLLSLISNLPVVVKDDENLVYIFNDNKGILSSDSLKDSNSKESAGIVQIATAESSSLIGSLIFAAVKNNAGSTFGASGSGISILKVEEEKIEESKNDEKNKENSKDKKEEKKEFKPTVRKLKVLNANFNDNKILENKAVSFTGNINSIKINNPATIISDIIDMYWDPNLLRLYVAVQLKSNKKQASGAKAIVVGRVVNEKLFFDQIVSNSAIGFNNQIIATAEQNRNVSISKIRTMKTSTLLNYLIVVGGNGAIDEVGDEVYALPLINKKKEHINIITDNEHGTLAKFDQQPKEYFINNFFVDRALIQPAKSIKDLLTNNDEAAQVGNGKLPLSNGQNIKEMFVVNDSVFVVVEDDTQTGTFYSQAIFDNLGRITSWTKWHRIGINNNIFAAGFDIITSQFWDLKNLNGVSILQRSNWQTEDTNELQKILNNTFASIGGVQGLFEFNKYNFFVATGFGKIALFKENSIEEKRLNVSILENEICSQEKSDVIIVNDDKLKEIKNITSSTIVSDFYTNNEWLVVGGTKGLAILIDKNSNGWPKNESIFNLTLCNYTFKKIGDYNTIKKIFFENQFLYVLTDKTFDRIEINKHSIENNKFNVVTLANIENIIFNQAVSFSDFIISDELGLLGTSIGLFRIGNSKNIRKISNQIDANWTYINVPNGEQPILKLYLTDSSNKKQLYVLTGYLGMYQTKVNRFYVNLTGSIDDQTIKPLFDLFIKNELSSFFDFENFKNNILNIGSTLFSFNSKDISKDASMKSVPALHTASRSLNTPTSNINLGLKQINEIYGILNSQLGCLIVNGNFGIVINK